MKRAENGPLDPELRDALRTLTQEQRALAAPADVENRVMRAWDDAHSTTSRRFGRDMWATAAAGLLAAALGYWWTSGTREPLSAPMQSVVSATWPSGETLAWLGADPSSLQVVHIRVSSTALAQQGYPVSDPDGDGLVDVEMIVGTEGIAHTVRLRPTMATFE